MVKKILGLLNLLMTAALFVACLWPLNPFPRNDISWLPGRNGVEFGKHGLILSSSLMNAASDDHQAYCSLEISLQPALAYVNNSATLLVVYTPDNPLQFRLMQYGDELLIRRNYRDKNNQLKNAEIELEHAFTSTDPVSFLVTSGPQGAKAYRNGMLVGASKRMGLSCHDFSGQLVLGNSPLSDNLWQGKLLGLAIYTRELTPQQISQHYAKTNSNPLPALNSTPQSAASLTLAPPSVADPDSAFARYTFAEGAGKIIHNRGVSERGSAAPDLHIPNSFKILHKKILTPPWKEFTADKRYVIDVTTNIAGFIPFGFLFCFYLAWDHSRSRAALFTVLAGAAISTTVEVLQIFIPSRTSGITDIITNTLGSAVGVLLWNSPPIQKFVSRLRRKDNDAAHYPDPSTAM